MSTETTVKKSNGANSATSKNSKKVGTIKSGKVTEVTVIKLTENADQPTENVIEQPANIIATESGTKPESKTKPKTEKKAAVNKAAKPVVKKSATVSKTTTGEKKIKLAATCYHYYRNWLKDFLRSYGGGSGNSVSSARFQKSPESYEGHITVLESEKVKGLKALEAWSKQNPDTKEMFWDIKK